MAQEPSTTPTAAEGKLKVRITVRVNHASDERSCKVLGTVCRLSGALSEGSKGYQGQESVECFTQKDLTDLFLG